MIPRPEHPRPIFKREPWINLQTYARDARMISDGTFEDGALVFNNRASEWRQASSVMRAPAAVTHMRTGMSNGHEPGEC